jgi:hypothetical protein
VLHNDMLVALDNGKAGLFDLRSTQAVVMYKHHTSVRPSFCC